VSEPDDIYTDPWFKQGYGGVIADDVRTLADAVATLRPPPCSVLDVGCGPGLLLERMATLGYDVYGYDGSQAALRYSRELKGLEGRVWLQDLRVPLGATATDNHKASIVVCTEVAEHLAAEYAPLLVARLANHLRWPEGILVFTAAHPGQGGTDHVNERPMVDWLTDFAACNSRWGGSNPLALDGDATRDLKARLAGSIRVARWYTDNIVVLRHARS
jgi:2-polyprenyl-3-methyl-5-hydroxy-6-metoxy-1,4-benzoquinol methylase